MNYLVPIDFSEQSRTAAAYAASLTRIWPGNLHLVHVIVPPEEESSYISVKTQNVKTNTVFELFTFQEQLRRATNVRSGADMISGEFASRVTKTATRERSNLIVMGMQGMSGLREYLYGSNTMTMIEEATLPVLAVPADSNFQPFRHIVFLTNHEDADIAKVESLGKISSKFKALLSVISINSNTRDVSKLEFQQTIRERIPFAAIHFEDRTHEFGVAEGLEEFVLTESVDLIGVSTGQSSLIRKMAGRTLADEFTFKAEVPVLFFPA
jgi:nucleotide-binding universal stress UspA family protein